MARLVQFIAPEGIFLEMWERGKRCLSMNNVHGGARAESGSESKWFALSVTARHEKVVSQLLRNKGFETFLPVCARRHHYQGRLRKFEVPLFAGYVFCRHDLLTRLPVVTTPGVRRIVGAGRVPIPVDNDEIGSLQRAVEAGVPMSPHPFWQSGQTARITSGPLAGIEGIVVRETHSMRLVLSVTLLQRSVLLDIGSECAALVQNNQNRLADCA
jgi:transcription antitermination factor NusG